MDFPHFTDLELFLMSGWIAYILIRLLADSAKLRLYVDFKDLKVKVGRPGNDGMQSWNEKVFGKQDVPTSHIHHFIFGMILMPVTFIALYWDSWLGPVLVGIVMALIGSEAKELVLMNWGQ